MLMIVSHILFTFEGLHIREYNAMNTVGCILTLFNVTCTLALCKTVSVNVHNINFVCTLHLKQSVHIN